MLSKKNLKVLFKSKTFQYFNLQLKIQQLFSAKKSQNCFQTKTFRDNFKAKKPKFYTKTQKSQNYDTNTKKSQDYSKTQNLKLILMKEISRLKLTSSSRLFLDSKSPR